MSADKKMREQLPPPDADAELRRRVDVAINIASSRRTLALAKVRCLPFDAKLRRLKKGLDEELFLEIAYAINESARSDRQNAKLGTVVAMLAKKADHLPSSQRARLDRRIGRLLPALPIKLGRAIILGYLSDPLKHRREIGLRRLRSEPISKHFVRFLWSRYCATGDGDLLKPIIREPIPFDLLNPQELVNSFDEDYWRMRAIEATLKADASLGDAFALSHPLPFIWACGRLGDRRMVSVIVDCVWEAPDQVPLIGIAAWAFGKLGAKRELARLEDLLNQLAEEFGVQDSELFSRRFF